MMLTKSISFITAASIAALSLAGCNSTGALTPTGQAAIDTAWAVVCPIVGSGQLASIVAASGDSAAETALQAALSICSGPAPTSVSAAGLDIVQALAVLLPYLEKNAGFHSLVASRQLRALVADTVQHSKRLDPASRRALEKYLAEK